jgi:hypothetical protein
MNAHRRQAGRSTVGREADGSFESALSKYERTNSAACGLVKYGSASARVSYEAPERVKSVIGENAATATRPILAAGPSATTREANTRARFPPAESPMTAIRRLPIPTSPRRPQPLLLVAVCCKLGSQCKDAAFNVRGTLSRAAYWPLQRRAGPDSAHPATR